MTLIRDIVIVLLILFATWLGSEQRGALVEMFKEHGIAVGAGILVFIVFHWWIFRLYAALVRSARQLADDRIRENEKLSQINDRLTAENGEYRERLLRIIDDRIKPSETEDER